MNYLIASESFRLIDEEINKIIKNKENIVKYDMNESSIDELIKEASYLSLLDEDKYIIASNSSFFASSKIKEEDSKKLIAYLNNPNPQTTIIFKIDSKIDERKKITKLMKEKYKIIDIAKPREYEMQKKVEEILKKAGFTISYEAVNYLIKSTLNNYDLIYNEIEKIKICFPKGTNINLDELRKLTHPVIDDNIFKLINEIVNKNIKTSTKLFKDLKILKEEPIVFINLLAREYRNMYLIKTNKTNKNDLMKILKLADWQYEKSARIAYQHSILELKEKLKQLYTLDLNIKSGKIDKYLGFELFLLNI